eukprot:TRINITY_DN20037_c0_g1_i1.p1 TRINITY_DN20037_c0_g1~~TRINITY_DN20037_c0_g1_i1.p1  ORF type:complete len:356 (-),score=101.23 TRINITY_DN20037_c0_g1_i1:208-1275(-)
MAGPCVVDALIEVAQESNVDSKAVAARRSAVEALTFSAQKGDERALAVLASSLQDWHVSVRKAALDALVEVALKGDRRVVYARLLAVRALSPAMSSGNKKAIDAVVACLKDAALTVRLAAFEELARIAREGDSIASGQVTARLEAVKALGSLASTTCSEQEQAIAILSTCLSDWHVAVRQAAAGMLQKLLTKEGDASMAAASRAVEAFTPGALEGDAKAMTVLTTALGCGGIDFAPLRRQALGAVVRVALAAQSAATAQLKVKVTAVKAMGKELLCKPPSMSERDREGVVAALSMCLQDWHADVWRPALDCLCKLAESTSGQGYLGELAVAALTPKACEGDAQAVACLSKLGKLG